MFDCFVIGHERIYIDGCNNAQETILSSVISNKHSAESFGVLYDLPWRIREGKFLVDPVPPCFPFQLFGHHEIPDFIPVQNMSFFDSLNLITRLH